ncbi:integrase [Gossypium australe]|uniref:Integrase n=1 Tax=Gossypium australe TaxID=47621 RepID=A0A5B6VXU1_9ROSI|nr:integrase [Gossypium australe]
MSSLSVGESRASRISHDGCCISITCVTEREDLIWVVVDRLTESTHSIPIRTEYLLEKLVELYVSDIVRLHRVLLSITFYRDPRFTSRFGANFMRL